MNVSAIGANPYGAKAETAGSLAFGNDKGGSLNVMA